MIWKGNSEMIPESSMWFRTHPPAIKAILLDNYHGFYNVPTAFVPQGETVAFADEFHFFLLSHSKATARPFKDSMTLWPGTCNKKK